MGFLSLLVIVIILGVYLSYTSVVPSNSVTLTTSTTFTSSNCQAVCVVWVKPNGSNPEALAISQDDSLVAASYNQTLRVFNTQGSLLWQLQH